MEKALSQKEKMVWGSWCCNYKSIKCCKRMQTMAKIQLKM